MANSDWGKRVDEIEEWLKQARAAHEHGAALSKKLDLLAQQIHWYEEKLRQAHALVEGNDDRSTNLADVRELAAKLVDVPAAPAVISEQAREPVDAPKGGKQR